MVEGILNFELGFILRSSFAHPSLNLRSTFAHLSSHTQLRQLADFPSLKLR